MPVIEIHNLTYTYNLGTVQENKALDDISFSVEKGEFLGIVGANGSGKSTLIQHLNGLICPTAGKVCILGKDTRDKAYREQLWQSVGLLFQFPEQQVFEATVYEEIAYGLKNMGLKDEEIKQRVEEALRNVGLDSERLGHTSPFCLSGGTLRRVAVAGILAMKPEILILDEPTAGLDPEGSRYILQTIKKFQLENAVTIIMVSHCINDLVLLSDSLAVLDQGKLCAWGPTRKVLANQELAKYDGLLPDYIKMLFELRRLGWKIDTGLLSVEEAAEEIAVELEEQIMARVVPE